MGPSSSLCSKAASILNLCSDTCADRPHLHFQILGILFRNLPVCLLGISCPSKFHVPTPTFFQGEFGYTIDEKMQVDKSSYLNTYGARLTGLEAQIKMQRSM